MPEETVDDSAATSQETTAAETHETEAAGSELAPEQGMTGTDEAGSGEVDVESLKKEVAELRSLKGKMGQELGRYRQRYGGIDADEPATADTGFVEPDADDEPAGPAGDRDARAAAEKQLGNELSQAMIMGDMATVRSILGPIMREEAQGVVSHRDAVQSERTRCADIYGPLLGKETLAKHDRAAAKVLRQNPGMGYRAAFLVAAHGDLLKAAETRGARNKEKELTAGNGGTVATGGRPSRPTGPVDLRKAIADAPRYGDAETGFDKM